MRRPCLNAASKSSTPPPAALPLISLDSGRPSPRSSFSGPSDYYKFPPAPAKVSSEAVAIFVKTKSVAVQTEIAVGVENDPAASESTGEMSDESEKSSTTNEVTSAQDPKAEGRAARLESEGGQIQPPGPRRRRDPCRVMYATTCTCELEDEEIVSLSCRSGLPRRPQTRMF